MEIYNLQKDVKLIKIFRTEIGRIDLDVCQQPRETLKHYYARQDKKPEVLINAGFFNMSNGETIFDLMNEGKIVMDYPLEYEGIGIKGDKELKFGKVRDEEWRDFVTAYPPLIKEGKAMPITLAKNLDYNARRTVLGFNKEYVYILLIEGKGMSFAPIQKILLDLKVDYGINLDGGGSTNCLYKGKQETNAFNNRAVDSVIAIYCSNEPQRKPLLPIKKTIYRVQLGAFSNRHNGYKLLQEVQKLTGSKIGMNYSKAYITYDGTYYRVQVGAFSNKKNADRVVDDLKQLGYNSFVKSCTK